jgi:hypothetical protein
LAVGRWSLAGNKLLVVGRRSSAKCFFHTKIIADR